MTHTETKMNLTQIKEQQLAEKVASSKKILRIRQQMLLMMVKKMLVENKEYLSFDQICKHPLVIKAADRFAPCFFLALYIKNDADFSNGTCYDITPKTLFDFITKGKMDGTNRTYHFV